MIGCLYGRSAATWVEPVVRDLESAGRGAIRPLSLESAQADPTLKADIHRLYVLPFDPPHELGKSPAPAQIASFVRQMFPKVEIFNSFPTQELCWDKLASQERLLHRGVPVPDTLVSSDPGDVLEFVREHGFAILKERFGCAGHGHVVLWRDGNELLGDGGSHQYRMELVSEGTRKVRDTTLLYPAPFYVQRLVTDGTASTGLVPGQLLRAYVVDGHVAFWTERYRERYVRPSDWIVNVSRGARYRFVLNVSEEARKVAVRAAEVVGMRAGAVDILRTSHEGHYVLEVDCDGRHMVVDRQFKNIPDYRDFFDFDRYLAESLLVEAPDSQAPAADGRRA